MTKRVSDQIWLYILADFDFPDLATLMRFLLLSPSFRVAHTCGYLPSEIVGKPGASFLLEEDMPWTAMAQRHSQ